MGYLVYLVEVDSIQVVGIGVDICNFLESGASYTLILSTTIWIFRSLFATQLLQRDSLRARIDEDAFQEGGLIVYIHPHLPIDSRAILERYTRTYARTYARTHAHVHARVRENLKINVNFPLEQARSGFRYESFFLNRPSRKVGMDFAINTATRDRARAHAL